MTRYSSMDECFNISVNLGLGWAGSRCAVNAMNLIPYSTALNLPSLPTRFLPPTVPLVLPSAFSQIFPSPSQ